jgi:hypothetical protein
LIKHIVVYNGSFGYEPLEPVFNDARFWDRLSLLIGEPDTARLNILMASNLENFELAWWLIRLSVERAVGKGRFPSI